MNWPIFFTVVVIIILIIIVALNKSSSPVAKDPPFTGYYLKSWVPQSVPGTDWNLGIWFSGETPQQSIQDGLNQANNISVGAKYLALGGGTTTGIWTGPSDFTYINSQLSAIKSKGWAGLCFDVEVCTPNVDFIPLFADCFSKCKAAGLNVMVTTSHMLPYACQSGSGQGQALIESWLNDPNVTYFSPQLYSDGTVLEPSDLSSYQAYQNKIIPAIPYVTDWVGLTTKIGINPPGYIVWNLPSSGLNRNYCGTSWENASVTCGQQCPNGLDNECPSGQQCYANTSCPRNYCGFDWATANSTCNQPCPNGLDSDCPTGQHCYATSACKANS